MVGLRQSEGVGDMPSQAPSAATQRRASPSWTAKPKVASMAAAAFAPAPVAADDTEALPRLLPFPPPLDLNSFSLLQWWNSHPAPSLHLAPSGRQG